jgi:hypothetical protein
MEKLYLAALNRPPTANEYAKILDNPKMRELPRVPANAQSASAAAYYQDIFWAILNSNEFILNH